MRVVRLVENHHIARSLQELHPTRHVIVPRHSVQERAHMRIDMLSLRGCEDVSQQLRSPGCRSRLIGNSPVRGIDYHDWISFADPALKNVVSWISAILDAVCRPDRVADPMSLHVRLAVSDTRGVPTGWRGCLSERWKRQQQRDDHDSRQEGTSQGAATLDLTGKPPWLVRQFLLGALRAHGHSKVHMKSPLKTENRRTPRFRMDFAASIAPLSDR